ncbi:expansin-A23-like [Gossypium australe]|uniref:Expansin n=1 Tax=Gossypium australe TaxID=47621 RepID=A0A5B6V5N1_9ROSI|nr:expansin-A23-like [Gossypium australe]
MNLKGVMQLRPGLLIKVEFLAPVFHQNNNNLFAAMATLKLFFSFLMVTVHLISSMAANRHMLMGNQMIDSNWYDAHATFYGDMSGGGTMQGACGYGDLFKQGYGLQTTALSTALFNNGLTCGACFEIKCFNDPQWCYPKAGSVIVTATNFCSPNYSKPDENWCNPPLKHFDLSKPMFTKLAYDKAGIIPVKYRRVLCYKKGGVQFQIKGNPYLIFVLLYNVGGAGDVKDVKIKGSSTGSWLQMSRNWGVNWQTGAKLVGQGLSFQVTTSDGKMIEFDNVVPTNWQFNQVFDGKNNF